VAGGLDDSNVLRSERREHHRLEERQHLSVPVEQHIMSGTT
jgi:hypothetical protein